VNENRQKLKHQTFCLAVCTFDGFEYLENICSLKYNAAVNIEKNFKSTILSRVQYFNADIGVSEMKQCCNISLKKDSRNLHDKSA
jgi:hypothetical protein